MRKIENNEKFDPSADPAKQNHIETAKTLVQYLWPAGYTGLKCRVIAAMLCLILAKLLNVGVPFILKDLVDSLNLQGAAALPIGLILAYAVARIGAQGFGELRDLLFSKVSQHAQRTVARKTFSHLHELSLRFHLDRQTGGLSRVIERGTKAIQFVLGLTLFNIMPTLLEILLVTATLYFKFGWMYAAVVFGTVFSYVSHTYYVTEWRLKHRTVMNKRDTEANTKAVDSLLNYETVKYFGNETHEINRYDQALASYEAAAIKNQSTLSVLNIGQGLIIGLGLGLLLWLASIGVQEGRLSIGDFVLLNTFLLQLYLPLNLLGFVYRETKQGLVDMDKMFELLRVNQEIKDKASAKSLLATKGDVEFKNVSFSYESDRKILKNINFSIPHGKTLAVVGPSGSGKSTLSRLMFRFYDVTDGEILIDGQNIQDLKQLDLRHQIGIVPQDTVLFNDTIHYNILYGKIDSTESQVVEAAKKSQIHEFVNGLPKKYDTSVGERGLKLSGGEKQRVAIARTILKDPAILIFDEATSALDSKTEKEIQASLKAISKNRTTLVIAHRLSTIVDADEIIVLKEGEIIERGTHSSLLHIQGEYAAMWARQATQKQNDQPSGADLKP
jgi:ABC-type transport system involved in Fe-S cluster assembly fused permease/ATPase subunit